MRYEEDEDETVHGSGDREISLGTGTVLGIFLALALVCSLFFGLGYSMGRKATPSPLSASAVSAATVEPTAPASASPYKPSAVTPAADLQVAQPSEPVSSSSESDSGTTPAGEGRTTAHDRPSTIARTVAVTDSAPTATPAAAGTPGAPATFVQVAAVSRREDADLLLTALKKRGYTGVVRPQAQDKLLHIQLGPFASRKDAESMRQRLIADGYNPIIK